MVANVLLQGVLGVKLLKTYEIARKLVMLQEI